MSGLLIHGVGVEVPGVTVVNHKDAGWAHLNAGDGRPRTAWPSQVILHKTKADDPERVEPGPGPSGRPERVAEFWDNDPAHSGAHIVVGGDYVACLADLVLFEAYHAGSWSINANPRSIGVEHYEEQGGIVYQGVIDNGVKIALAIAEHCGIQLQVPRPGTYSGPLYRFRDGGRTLVGFFGHRDVTPSRSRWDPGDEIFRALISAGAEAYDFNVGEDLQIWRARQEVLNARGAKLVVDGIPGPATTAVLRAEGYRGGVWALGKT